MKETDLMVEALRKGEHEVRFYSLLPEFAVRGCAKKALQIALQGNGSFSVFRDHLVSQYSVLFHFDAPRPTPASPRRHVHLAPIEAAAPVPKPNPRPVEEDSIAIVRARPFDTFKNLVKEFHITSTPRFFVPCSDPSSMARGLNASFPSFLESEEGVFSVQMSSGTHEGKTGLFVTFPLSMPCSQFLDHRKKGEEKAKALMKRLTHGAALPPEIVCLLGMSYFQTYVTYEHEQPSCPHADNHMAYGPLVRKRGVCEGYSWALIHMLKAAGIPAALVTGKNQGVNHAWVKVTIQGRQFHIDPTITRNCPGIVIISRFLVSDSYLRNRGYVFEGNSCSTTWYEDFDFLQKAFLSKLEAFIAKGASPELLRQRFAPAKE